MIKVVIFDLDEVLIKSKKQTLILYRHLFNFFGIKFPEKNKQRLLYTQSEKNNYKSFFSKINKKNYFDYRKSIDFKDYIKFIKISKNTKIILKFLKENKIKMAIATNRGSSTKTVLDYFKIREYFDLIITEKDIKKPKPDPFPINLAIKKLKIKKEEVLYVGDDIIDIKAGKGAGVKMVLYGNKFKGADYYISNLIQIKKIIKDVNE